MSWYSRDMTGSAAPLLIEPGLRERPPATRPDRRPDLVPPPAIDPEDLPVDNPFPRWAVTLGVLAVLVVSWGGLFLLVRALFG